MKYTYTTMLAAILTIAGTLLFTSCESNEENVPSTVIEKMQFEAHFSHSRDLYEAGNKSLISIRSELGATQAIWRDGSRSTLIESLEWSLSQMEIIDQYSIDLLRLIHHEKKEIVNALNCPDALGKFDSRYAPTIPIKGVALSGNREDFYQSNELEKKIIDYRNSIVTIVANSHFKRKGSEKSSNILLDPKMLSRVPLKGDKCDIKQLQNVLANVYPDDLEGLIDIIVNISPRTGENKLYSARKALHYLCIQEARILKARKLAFDLFNARYSSCGTSFDKITPIVSGPELVTKGSEVELELMIAALDSYNNPEVTCSEDATIEVRDGIAYLKLKIDKTITLKGTIGIRNKQGAMKIKNWEKTVVVK
mmetsp:Transcript_47210/g.62507  ORF Transcript_47210/g.62507 Transcript_47210/m.62507 type:complete len:366 (+) Transcript_47210:35-1132(+)